MKPKIKYIETREISEEEQKMISEIEEGQRIKKLTGNIDHYPVRYVTTHISHSGIMMGVRIMSFAAQGRNTHETMEEAQTQIENLRKNNSKSTLLMFGETDTFEVRATQCYPGHFDPIRTVFES